ncbi:hypothetical protein L861_23350 [Litchfieldella anticariensis FP35 = DSM 16096]|uniref:Colicin immunity protein n=1 Tax=Litchfieldella anticariensis (strain DSM 16096 / CECT 5854 / CIP 108499 / LMG 22089 / FP35) TaxID=1121939 RepID=S2L662_LITA3|nr:bacteriocin immunity protein [Halomonas anticariensis]EPC03249.1 hypothetical protein L861_23350 [Halomonas anticariensis FP35 = DSM 16096]
MNKNPNLPLKFNFEDYTEAEFRVFMQEMFDAITGKVGGTEDEQERYLDKLIDHFSLVTEHERGMDVIFYPEPPIPEGADISQMIEHIIEEVKRWRAEKGLPGFKAE